MAEYLAPGVYVEEVDTGNRPIEGVSTSTAGVVGVTERGPVDIPVLVTSYAAYQRVFGGTLDADDFVDLRGVRHSYTPHAVEGFFTNRGRRMFVTRVLPQNARHAGRMLHARTGDAVETRLLRPAARDTGAAGFAPLLYVTDTTSAAANTWVRIHDGSRTEYHQVASAPGPARHVGLMFPLQRAHASGTPIRARTYAAPGAGGALGAAVDAGANEIVVRRAGLAANDVVAVGPAGRKEIRTATDAAPTGVVDEFRLTLDEPLHLPYPIGANVEVVNTLAPVTAPINLDLDANPGDPIVFSPLLPPAGTYIEIGTERIMWATPGSVTLDAPLGVSCPAGSVAEVVQFSRTITAAPIGNRVQTESVVGAREGMMLRLGANPPIEVTRVHPFTNELEFAALPAGLIATNPITRAPRNVVGNVTAGASVLPLDNREDLRAGDVLEVDVGPLAEYVVVLDVPGDRSAPNDPGNVVLMTPLQHAHAAAAVEVLMPPFRVANHAVAALLFDEGADAATLSVGGVAGLGAGDIVRVTTPDGRVLFADSTAAAAFANAGTIELTRTLEASHGRGSAMLGRDPLMTVEALDAGRWGDRLRIGVRDEEEGLASRADLVALNTVTQQIDLTTVTGIEPGTILELLQPDGAPVAGLLKVQAVDRAARTVTLSGGLGVAHAAAFAGAPPGAPIRARSREFQLIVTYLRRPDPAVPTRDETVLDTEVHRHLSMDSRHSRYFVDVIGSITLRPGEELRRWDRRTPGESAYIRVADVATMPADLTSTRLGPENLRDLLPTGTSRPARLALANGDDSPGTMTDAMYVGLDNHEPALRTGLFSLRNEQDISIVAAPGQRTPLVQQALISHCEIDRYRFAVLDGPPPPADQLNDVRFQRQQFDTRYAAIYHPWLLIPDPTPSSVVNIEPYAIPPSGHVMGVYARTDQDRGVHKAPANEVVRGIIGLSRSLDRGEHDILNPSPVNINVVRDFRPNNRGIRIWGGRVITSDTDYKYVNVRRTLIFLEKSIDRGLQWVVFEPNSEPTWARVRRSIRNFLTVVWRNGALEGPSPEHGFFVKCDRTTMTQSDIDAGRLVANVGVAIVKPAEYVIIRIGLWTADRES
ncbi:MAG: phage tail sheath subtilisin-like domain-containing protein [Deltaproteobacteria bacterium]|jgi:phage tail sheath protein FI